MDDAPHPITTAPADTARAMHAAEMRGGSDSGRGAAQTASADRIAELETLLARNLVFDRGSAEDGLEAIGGPGRMWELIDAHRAANPDLADVSSTGLDDGEIAF